MKDRFFSYYSNGCYKENFVISKIKNTVPWTYVINDVNGQEIVGNMKRL